jgi:hypothetical protein
VPTEKVLKIKRSRRLRELFGENETFEDIGM